MFKNESCNLEEVMLQHLVQLCFCTDARDSGREMKAHIFIFFCKEYLPTMANYSKSCMLLMLELDSKNPFRTEVYDDVKKRLRRVRSGVVVAELCIRDSHMTYQCSPECNQT